MFRLYWFFPCATYRVHEGLPAFIPCLAESTVRFRIGFSEEAGRAYHLSKRAVMSGWPIGHASARGLAGAVSCQL
jgi:hypothetical protein